MRDMCFSTLGAILVSVLLQTLIPCTTVGERVEKDTVIDSLITVRRSIMCASRTYTHTCTNVYTHTHVHASTHKLRLFSSLCTAAHLNKPANLTQANALTQHTTHPQLTDDARAALQAQVPTRMLRAAGFPLAVPVRHNSSEKLNFPRAQGVYGMLGGMFITGGPGVKL